MDNVARLRRGDRQGPQAADDATLRELRAQMETWLAATRFREPRRARSGGPRRDRLVLDASDLPLATGVRLGELLTVRRADCVPIDKGRWRIRVTGTIVTDKETGKLYRKPKPKTKNSVGSIVVADFAVATLERLLAAAGEDTEAMLFTNRDGGSHGVTPRTFRKTVTTRVK